MRTYILSEPCPFCLSMDRHQVRDNRDGTAYFKCEKCGEVLPFFTEKMKAKILADAAAEEAARVKAVDEEDGILKQQTVIAYHEPDMDYSVYSQDAVGQFNGVNGLQLDEAYVVWSSFVKMGFQATLVRENDQWHTDLAEAMGDRAWAEWKRLNLPARLTHHIEDQGPGMRDVEVWTCSKHGHVCTTEVGADPCCPKCEAESYGPEDEECYEGPGYEPQGDF